MNTAVSRHRFRKNEYGARQFGASEVQTWCKCSFFCQAECRQVLFHSQLSYYFSFIFCSLFFTSIFLSSIYWGPWHCRRSFCLWCPLKSTVDSNTVSCSSVKAYNPRYCNDWWLFKGKQFCRNIATFSTALTITITLHQPYQNVHFVLWYSPTEQNHIAPQNNCKR